MQWIDNPNLFSMRKTFTDMVKCDRFAIFYRGLIPAFNAQVYLYVSLEWAQKLVFDYKIENMEYLWPILYMTGCLFAHPCMVLASTVYCGRLSHPRSQNIYGNSFVLLQKMVKSEGIRSLYVGFMPAMVLYTLSYYK